MNNTTDKRRERGGAGVKLLIVGVILFLVGFAAINYIPTAYDGQSFKQEMETSVMQAAAVGTSQADNLKTRLARAAVNNNLPPNPFIEVKQDNGKLQARVYYVKDVPMLPFGLFNYKYTFDYTATPAGFLFK